MSSAPAANASPFEDLFGDLDVTATDAVTGEPIEIDEDAFTAGMLVGLFAQALDDASGRGGSIHGSPFPLGTESVGHVLTNGVCLEGHGTASALRAIYDAAGGASAGVSGPCPTEFLGDSSSEGAYVSVFRMPKASSAL